MSRRTTMSWVVGGVMAACTVATARGGGPPKPLEWSTVANNTDTMPGSNPQRNFNSYNAPSVNTLGLVVFRGRSRGGPPGPVHGIYTRDMSLPDDPIVRILDRTTDVPPPNNLGETFVETPAFPRIDAGTSTIVTRGNHPPVWEPPDETETPAGTSGIYANPFGDLITGMTKLGGLPEFPMFAVPGVEPPTAFEVFPGAPSVTVSPFGVAVVFKGNFSLPAPTPEDPDAAAEHTGVYFRDLEDAALVLPDAPDLTPAGGNSLAVRIADTTSTTIPGTPILFGVTTPPSAAGRHAVFTGFDDEENPTVGGLFLAPLIPDPPLTTLVEIGDQVPEEPADATLTRIGEGLAFDGRFVGFWGAWGTFTVTDPETGEVDCVDGCKDVIVQCPTEGNAARIDFCLLGSPLAAPDLDPEVPENHTGAYVLEVPVHQGFFVHDILSGETRAAAKTGGTFDDFVFWNFSGQVPDGDDDHDGEPARWRASAFIAVSSGPGSAYRAAFKAASGLTTGIFLRKGPGKGPLVTLADTTMNGQALDPEAHEDSLVTELSLEREGLRGGWLTIGAKMDVEGGAEDLGMAGIYVMRIP